MFIRIFFRLNVMKLLHIFHLFLLLTISPIIIIAQEIYQPSARFQALGGVSAPLTGCWSVFGNQAGLADLSRIEIAGSFQSRFLVSELSSRAGLVGFPVQSSVLAFSIYQFGEIPFRHEKFGLSYARKIIPHLNFGIQFNYYRLFLSEDNKSVGSAGMELGVQYLMNRKLILGIHLLNPYQTKIKLYSGNFAFDSLINFGILYRLSDSFGVTSEIENDFDNQFRIEAGMEYSLLNNLWLRVGSSGKPLQLTAGFGFQLKKLMVDFASVYSQYLGNSPSVSFQYQF